MIASAIGAEFNPPLQVNLEEIDGGDWSETWKAHWQPQVFGKNLCVCPGWLEPPADARVTVKIDPGQAFGTGSHETTALCLTWLSEAKSLAGATVIDYGCGSGVLAIAAAKLGAGKVIATDIDPVAVAAAQDNARVNGVEQQLQCGLPSAFATATADVLIANILLEPLCQLSEQISAGVRQGGQVLLSGILDTQIDELKTAYCDAFDLSPPILMNEWVMIAGRKK